MVDDIRNLLVLDPENRDVKVDLFALNIQRGRDHGIPSFNFCRQKLGLGRLPSFDLLTNDPN